MVTAARRAPREQASQLPLGPGVYRFRDQAGRVLYVGRAVSLRRRVVSYWGDLGDRGHLVAMVSRIARVEAVPCASAHEAAWLERNLLQRRKPPWNRDGRGGQESEVWIRLSQTAEAPGVSVAFRKTPGDQARYFGPYLGWRKARDAVSGLDRVLPLGRAPDQPGQPAGTGGAPGTGRTPGTGRASGTARELARARGRGVPPVDGEVLASTLCAALDRDPAALDVVRAELIRRRDAAAAGLAFEFAGRVQAELDGLDWVTAEQKATQAQPCEFDVHGQAGGMLVTFEIRGGRLSGWTQRAGLAGSPPAPPPYLDWAPPAPPPYPDWAPPDWAGFARRTAELAALLAG
jgi:excinuclease ABC subunit C